MLPAHCRWLRSFGVVDQLHAREFLVVAVQECSVCNRSTVEDDDVIDDWLTILRATCILRLTLNSAAGRAQALLSRT